MRERYRLHTLDDEELLTALPKLAQHDREHTADLLAHMAEVDERRLFADLGFPSMWEYCLVALGMCKTTAWRKLTAARICRRFPGTFERVASGELQVAVVAQLRKVITDANGAELLRVCEGKSFDQAELLLAARFPRPDVGDSVRRVASESGSIAGSNERVEALSPDRFAVRFTADAEFLHLLEEVRGLSSHSRSGDFLPVLKAALEARRTELLKRRFGVGRKPRAKRPPKPATQTRHVPADVARDVYERDGGQCSYVSPNGRRCSARRQLQVDHIHPHSRCGRAIPANLRLLCQAHNQLAARRYFGARYLRSIMKQVAARRRSQRTGASDEAARSA